MILPKLTYKSGKVQRQILSFLGLNRTENTQYGEMSDSYGISTASYPCITQRESRKVMQEDVSDVFEWDGKLVIVKGNKLYYDGILLCNVSPDKKQFAVVNTQIVIMPDKIAIDIAKGTYRQLSGSVTTTSCEETEINNFTAKVSSTYFTSNSLRASPNPVTSGNVKSSRYKDNVAHYKKHQKETDTIPATYVYGNISDTDTVNAVREQIKKNNWDIEGRTVRNLLEHNHGDVIASVTKGDIVPVKMEDGFKRSFDIVSGTSYIYGSGWKEEPAEYNEYGYYGVIKDIIVEEELMANVLYKYNTYYVFDVYNANGENASFADMFSVGDCVNISNTADGFFNVTHKRIQSIDAETNTLYFASDTFKGEWYAKVENDTQVSDMKDGYVHFVVIEDGEKKYYTPSSSGDSNVSVTALIGDYVCLSNSELTVYRAGTKIASYTCRQDEDNTPEFTHLNALPQGDVKIEVPFPELDYICSHNNRLWGVSNKDNTIYASSLGIPNDFYDHSTNSTASYSLAVASDDDFSAIFSYGDSVLCFKEHVLHKILGDTPKDFYKADYTVAGVQKDSLHSMAVINETLYYKGVFGVYAYSGGMPVLISEKLGNMRYTDGRGGAFNNCYYLSMRDENGAPGLFVYDIGKRLWIKEDNCYAEAFAVIDQKLCIVIDSVFYQTGENEAVEWRAEFVPFDETSHAKKGYSKIRLRADMEKGAWMQVEIKEDNGIWRVAHTVSATDELTFNIPLRLGRCDRFAVRLSGKGKVTVRSMVREFLVGSEV